MLYAFFWVIHKLKERRQPPIHNSLTSTIPYLTPTHAMSPSHTHLWPQFGSLPSTTCSVPGPNPTLSPSHWLRLFSTPNFSRINTPTFLKPGPPLWSSGQSFWLQIQRSRFRFPALPDFLSSSGSGTGSTQPREVN